MIDPAPGWQIRCPKCGRAKPYGEVGIRIGATSIGKRVLAWCTKCHRLRWAIVDRIPEGKKALAATWDEV
jgi:hypothetical protein